MEYIKQLETKDLILRKAKTEDAQDMLNNFWSQENSAKYMLWTPINTLEEAKERLQKVVQFQKDHLAFFVYEKSSGQAIGMAAMTETHPDVFEDGGIGIGEDFVGKGYGKQILKALFAYIFGELNAKEIVCSCHTDNTASAKLQQSCGMKYTHSEMVTRKKDNLTYKSDYYKITREEWKILQNNL